MTGVNESSLHSEVKSRKGRRVCRVETRWVDLNGKDNFAIIDSN